MRNEAERVALAHAGAVVSALISVACATLFTKWERSLLSIVSARIGCGCFQ